MKEQTSSAPMEYYESDLAAAIILQQKYGRWLKDRFFEVKTKTDSQVVEVQVLLRNAVKSFYYPVEGRLSYRDQDLTLNDARDFLFDFIDAYFNEYLAEGEETYLTIDWSNYDCDGIELQLRGQILNLYLEEMADGLLTGKSENPQALLN